MYDHPFDFVFLWGGRGSAKTSDIVRLLTFECLNEDYFRCIVVIRDANRLKDSIYQQFKDFIEDSGLGQYFNFKEVTTKIDCVNGNNFIFRNGKDARNAKGLSNYNYGLFEEVDQIDKDDYDYIVGTIRPIEGAKMRVYHTFNPESRNKSYKEHWLYKDHFQGVADPYCTFEKKVESIINGKRHYLKYQYIHSTCDDNPKCPVTNIMFYESFKNKNKAKYNIWRLGRWSNKDTENQFAHLFDYEKHVTELEFDDGLPIHLVFDQNYMPYSTCTVWQIHEENANVEFRLIDEITLRPPNNDTASIVDEIKYRFDGHPCIIYGDFSGKSRNQRIERTLYQNHYDYINRNLGEFLEDGGFRSYIIMDKVTPNPPLLPRREILNGILEERGNFRIRLSPNCTDTIADFEQGEVDMLGNFKKERVKGVELLGHCMDTVFYLLYGTFKTELFENKGLY